MRIYTTPRSTAAPYDRAPVTKALIGAAGALAPHGAVTRFTYTVPTARKCVIEQLYAFQMRPTAAAPVGIWQISLNYLPSGGGGGAIVLLDNLDNTIGAKQLAVATPAAIAFAGDIISGQDSDASTGGTTEVNYFFKGTEFDA